ncbi:hypothetical protein AVEN_180312-1 [Araneus ventricosus]|uniref:Uncharacterized protein n=1 Tax=Araneus ventricosus TaxID=182803 RepID=A0A4Y2P3Q6_ARAVE|nr:hypothetical protein AVEN_180312-1 [Araneus ventricosus]
MSRFAAAQGIFCEGPRYSDQKTRTTPDSATPLQTSAPHQREDVCPPIYYLMCNRQIYTADLPWNRVSNLEPPAPKPRPYHQATEAHVITQKHNK